MGDVHACTEIGDDCHEGECRDRIFYIREKVELLLATFDMFRQSD